MNERAPLRPPAPSDATTLTRLPDRSTNQPSQFDTVAAGDSTLAPAPERIDRYRVERLLGQGGFGRVWLGHDDELGRRVAIKIPRPDRIRGPEDVEEYLREARIAAGLDHPHIVPVYDVGRTAEGTCFVVSKYIEGTDLKHRMQQGRVSYAEAATLAAQVADALHYAHTHGLTHRDIKPENILLDAAGRPFVTDFGLARRDDDAGGDGGLAGTPAYMSPEHVRGDSRRLDGRSDIFSLGVVLYELLLARRPFQGNTHAALMEQIASLAPQPPREVDPHLPAELERICLKALAKRATDRYTTAKDLAHDLRQFVERQRLTAPSRGRRPAPRKSWIVAYLGGATLLAAACVAVAIFVGRTQREPKELDLRTARPEAPRPRPVLPLNPLATGGRLPKAETLPANSSAPIFTPSETFEQALAELDANGQSELKQRWLDRLHQKQIIAQDPRIAARGAKVVAGRILPDGKDPRLVMAQMEILDHGYFATLVSSSNRPLELRLHGYEPLDFKLPPLKDANLTWLGTIRLPRPALTTLGSLQAQVVLESGEDASAAEVTAQIFGGETINNPYNGIEPRAVLAESTPVEIGSEGRILQAGFSPCRYYLFFKAPGHVAQWRAETFQPGRVLNLGVIALEVARQVRIEYYPSPRGDFSASERKVSHLKPGPDAGRWKSDPAVESHELLIKQTGGEISFAGYYSGTQMAFLGKGPLDEHRQVDIAAQRLEDPSRVPFQSGGVYLLRTHDGQTERWTLLQTTLERPGR